MIYGLSRFEFADNSKCSSFNIDVTINTPDTYILNVNNVKYVSNVIFQADIYTPNLKTFCNPTL
jgi:hypothetical protein